MIDEADLISEMAACVMVSMVPVILSQTCSMNVLAAAPPVLSKFVCVSRRATDLTASLAVGNMPGSREICISAHARESMLEASSLFMSCNSSKNALPSSTVPIPCCRASAGLGLSSDLVEELSAEVAAFCLLKALVAGLLQAPLPLLATVLVVDVPDFGLLNASSMAWCVTLDGCVDVLFFCGANIPAVWNAPDGAKGGSPEALVQGRQGSDNRKRRRSSLHAPEVMVGA